MLEFTGERVIPGQAGIDLWNEHLARYAFAARFATGRRVLDAGCGAGYGSAELAATARSVLGVDASPEAVQYARDHYSAPNLRFLGASCAALPLPDASLDLVVAFEVIEHLVEWQRFLGEARRVLAPAGQLIVSTPNKEYYAESRGLTGPNPYHVHEFDFEEFSARLRDLFPWVTLFLQNHVDGIGFQPITDHPAAAPQLRATERQADPREAHFFLALCSLEPQPDPPAFLYLPGAGNVLRERELHIGRLEAELATKDRWLEDLRTEKQGLVDMFRAQTVELERSNRWAEDLGEKLTAAQDRIVQLQQELEQTISGYEASIAAYEAEVRASIAGYEAQIAELGSANREKAEWAARLDTQLEAKGQELLHCIQLLDTAEATAAERTRWAAGLDAQLAAKGQELLHCIQLLDTAEATVVERTQWAMRLDAEVQELGALLSAVRASRWLRLGRTVGLGPVLPTG